VPTEIHQLPKNQAASLALIRNIDSGLHT
jgi:hypothetical protein